ncbi:MAG: NTP transferase domain-containing protein [Gemmatimonadaceae bacterium]
MHGLILAGGAGTRLAADGIGIPKALVPVAGRPLLLALAERLAALGCASVTCAVHEDAMASLARAAPLAGTVRRLAAGGTRFLPCRTPSSLHTLDLGLSCVPPGEVFVSMVDTVMAPDDWRLVHEGCARGLASGAAAVLAVTPCDGGDDAPLWARVTPEHEVTMIGSARSDPPLVTGGVYALGAAARARVPAALAAGRERMRAFLAELVDSGAEVRAVEVECVVDVDHERDLVRANAHLAAAAARAEPRA